MNSISIHAARILYANDGYCAEFGHKLNWRAVSAYHRGMATHYRQQYIAARTRGFEAKYLLDWALESLRKSRELTACDGCMELTES